MLPTQDTAHVAEGLALVIGQYKGKANLAGMLKAGLNRVQDLENVLWAVINSQLLTRTFPAGTAQGQASGPPDQALLQVADLVGCPAGTFTTSELALLVQCWILARRSQGRTVDLEAILTLAFGAGNFTYQDLYPAAFMAWAENVSDLNVVNAVAQALQIARPAGVAGELAYGNWPGSMFFLGGYGVTGSGLKDHYSAADPAGLLAGAPI